MEIFSKSFTDTDINKRLAIPAKILPSLPAFNGSHAVTVPIMHGTKMWPIVCTIRKRGHKKPAFSRGWRKFVVRNNFEVGDEFTLLKVQDKSGSFHYRVRVDKPARPSGGLSPPTFALNLEVDETNGTGCTKARNFQNKQQQILMADAPIKQREAVRELADVVADAPVAFVDHVIAKPASRIFGTNYVTHLMTGEESEMGKPPLHSNYNTNKKRESNYSADPAEDGGMAYDTSQAVGDAYYKIHTERLNLDLILGLPTPYAGEVMNLDLTLAPPIVDGGQEIIERATETALLQLSKAEGFEGQTPESN